jgi:nucleoside-diphosphate-sugar epimerase
VKILLTGASGFVGAEVLHSALQRGLDVRPAYRSKKPAAKDHTAQLDQVIVPGLAGDTDWSVALRGVDVVIHCAARAHVMRDDQADPLAVYRSVNVDGTLSLAKQAANFGVKRFIFLSSIGVNGAETFGVPFSIQSAPSPHSPYALSKYEAELGLQELSKCTGMEGVIIRAPLVYGPGAPGNFGSLTRLLKRGWPMPLGAIHNQRSLVSLENLVDLILTCTVHPAAANQIFLVSDGEDISTTELLRRMGIALGKPACLIPVSAKLLRAVAGFFGKSQAAQSLCGSLQVDISKTCELLDWKPPLSVDEGLRRLVDR